MKTGGIAAMMDRRKFTTRAVMGVIVLGSPRSARAQEATPEPSVTIELAPGLLLINPRFDSIASGTIPAFLGEYRNDTGRTFDTPVLGMTFYDGEGNIVGGHYATPVLPVSVPGSQVPITGEFYEFDPLTEPWDSVRYFVCSDLAGAFYVDQASTLDVEIDALDEERGEDSYIAEGSIRNNGAAPAENIGVYAIFRNKDGVFVGHAWSFVDRPIPPSKTIAFSVDANVNTAVPFDPFDRMTDSEYEVELVLTPFTSGYSINCSSFAPPE
jgi:hypothetical protein